jgi:glucosamine--fructose-6-phosphate aminotransferase (isomerizing)
VIGDKGINMCGITAGIAQRNIAPILLEGLKRLEYRGYDSAGLAVLNDQQQLTRLRVCGKVQALCQAVAAQPLPGKIGIAHTRWATHGSPSENNAHPHMVGQRLAIVHNGIIENHQALKAELMAKGCEFESETDSEVIVHFLHKAVEQGQSLRQAVQAAVLKFKGSYALVVVDQQCPDTLIAARAGSPLVIGQGIGEHFVASDIMALLPVTQNFTILQEGDIAEIHCENFAIYDQQGQWVTRLLQPINLSIERIEKGAYRHFMQKEIWEQPAAIAAAIAGRVKGESIQDAIFGHGATATFAQSQQLQLVACGTSYHAAMVGKSWIESIVGMPCEVLIASEMRYQRSVTRANTLLVALSQSGETADTLAALKSVQDHANYCGTLGICNVAESALVREVKHVLLTQAGPEIGVASTKAFTTQLVALFLLMLALAQRHGLAKLKVAHYLQQLRTLPEIITAVLKLDRQIERWAHRFADKNHALFLGRGIHYPIAKEGALKLKEISYIHAEAYPAGELKHGPLALIDQNMPVIFLVPNDELLDKIKSNIEEVRARSGELFIVAAAEIDLTGLNSSNAVIQLPKIDPILAPLIFSIPLQLLAYHVAVLKGTDVDQPRNLAKSVTVE